MYDDEGGVGRVTAGRAFHVFVPWIVLFVIVLAVLNAWGTFQRSDKPEWNRGSSAEPTATPSAPTTSTAVEVKGREAVVRKDVKLRSLPNDTSEILATAKKDDVLEILVKDAGHFKVKDTSGHVGWIPNDTEYIKVRDKK